MPVQVIAGLGNPGPEYAESRHNVGFVVIDALARELNASWSPDRQVKHAEVATVELAGVPVRLVKPMDYMNRSGRVLGWLCHYYRIPVESVAAIYDDITIEPGRLRITVRGGDAGHNGVADMLSHLGDGFIRFRIGIGPKPRPEMDLKDFVLGKFPPEHRQLIETHYPHYREGLISLVKQGPDLTMNQFNRRKQTDESNDDETV